MVGVAVKVTIVPAQTGLAEADIVTLTGKIGFTNKFTVLLNVWLQPVAVTLNPVIVAMVLLAANGKLGVLKSNVPEAVEVPLAD